MKKHNKHKHRNNAPRNIAVAKSGPASPRPRRRLKRGEKPSFWTAASAIAGGVGGAALGAFANREGWDPRWVGALMTGVGGLGAYKLDGNLRLASYGFAAAGAGDSILKWMEKDKPEKKDDKPSDATGKDAQASTASAKNDNQQRLANSSRGLRQAGNGASLDRAFNRVRDRLHRIYDDDGEAAFIDEEAA